MNDRPDPRAVANALKPELRTMFFANLGELRSLLLAVADDEESPIVSRRLRETAARLIPVENIR